MLEFVDAIVSGRLAPGTRLPKETALTETYEISRGVARESMRALEERGLVTVKHGGHTIVNPREELKNGERLDTGLELKNGETITSPNE